MPNYITTYTGLHMIPTEPKVNDIRIEDMAHALSLITRGNGHVKQFFSVGQHCIHCALEAEARGYSDRVVLACLLHDGAEAYLSDVPSPFKPYLKEYNDFEDRILDVIFTKYLGSKLTYDEYQKMKQVDHDMLYYDLKTLLNEHMAIDPPEMKTEFSYDVRPFEDVEKQYLSLFEKYMKRI